MMRANDLIEPVFAADSGNRPLRQPEQNEDLRPYPKRRLLRYVVSGGYIVVFSSALFLRAVPFRIRIRRRQTSKATTFMSKITLNIFGRTYDVEVGSGDELTIYSLAEFVEQKLNEVQRDTGIVDTQKLAILAALNIADELFRLKNSRENISGIFDKKADEMIKVLDEALSA
jgi:cell division protein ZapA